MTIHTIRLGTSTIGAVVFGIFLAASSAEAITVPGDYPSIQAALNAVMSGAAPNGSVINLQPATYYESLLIYNAAASVTVRGAGAASTIVNASGRGVPVLRIVRASGVLRFENITFQGGVGGPGNGGGFTFQDASPILTDVVVQSNTAVSGGGGILTRSNAQFARCQFRNNSAAQFGGGLVITTGSKPTFSNCQILNNASGLGGPGVGSIGSGGGVHVNDASPTFRGCVITGNQSKFAGGGLLIIGVYSSAYGTARLYLEDTEVSNNVSARYSSSDNPAEGGGIHVEDNAVATLVRSHVINNSANTGGGLNGYRSRYEVTSSIIEGNHAPDPLNVGGFGGGINMSSNNVSSPLRPASSLVIADSVVRNNDARIAGGVLLGGDQLCGSSIPSCTSATATRASLQVTDSLIDNNTASAAAGGLRIDRTDGTITNTHILRNVVPQVDGFYGGGILLATGSNVTLTGTTIAHNASGRGGGLFVDAGTVINIASSRIYANSSPNGGGMYVGSLGAPSGTVQNSTIADNSTYQILEQACGALQATILRYVNNSITPRTGQSDLYYSVCGGATATISAFNALPSGLSSGNTSSAPTFSTFLATPDVGASVLSWSVARVSNVVISGAGPQSGDTGTVDVAPQAMTGYSLNGLVRTVNASRLWGVPADSPVSGDFDGDGKKDLAVYRGSTGQWLISASSGGVLTYNWGSPALGDVPVPADYDGDGVTDVGVFRQSTGQWLIRRSSAGMMMVSWGSPSLGDQPIALDFDGDGKADVGIYRRSTGEWIIKKSAGGVLNIAWGAPTLGDVPVPADYDGDGRADIAVYRSSTGQWFIARSTAGPSVITWGSAVLGDFPVSADFDGDGKADVAVVRPLTGEWLIARSSGGSSIVRFGTGDAQVPGNYDGVGRAQLAIWRAATGSWLVQP